MKHAPVTNALIQRVRRHTGMTTLFRKAVEPTRRSISQAFPLVLGHALPLVTPTNLPVGDPDIANWAPDISISTPNEVTSSIPEATTTALTEQPNFVSTPPNERRDLPPITSTLPVARPAAVQPLAAPGQASSTVAPTTGTAPLAPPTPPVQAKWITPGEAPAAVAIQRPSMPVTTQSATVVQTKAFTPGDTTVSGQTAPSPAQPVLPGREQIQHLPQAGAAQTQSTKAMPAQSTTQPVSSASGQAPDLPSTGVVQPQRAAPTAATSPARSSSTAAAPQSEEDRTWARLQAIYRRHKELEATQTGAPRTASPTASVQRQPTNPSRAPDPQPQPTRAQATAGMPASRASTQPGPQSDQGPISAPDVSQVQPTQAPSESGSTVTSQTMPQSALVQRRESVASIETNSVTPTPEASVQMPLTSGISATSVTPNAQNDMVDSSSPTEADTLPLEAVWPVQALPQQPTSAAPVQRMVSETTPEGESGLGDEAPNIDKQSIREQLKHVKTGQPTDSTVDVVAPRRPRPVRRLSAPENVAHSAAVQREPAAQTMSEEPAPATETTRLIETEVGPLPADLWQLIGASPPAPTPTRTPNSVQRETADGEQPNDRVGPVELGNAQPMTEGETQVTDLNVTPRPDDPERMFIENSSSEDVTHQTPSADDHRESSTENQSAAAFALSSASQALGEDQPSPSPPSTVQRTVTAAQKTLTPSVKRVADKQTPVSAIAQVTSATKPTVQRQTAEDDAPVDDEKPEKVTTSGEAPTVSAKPAEIDTDELARQVYTQLKRKLAVEQERLRPSGQR